MLNADIKVESESSDASAPDSGHGPAPINVWVVDDNKPLRSTLREILDRCQGLRCKVTFHSPNAVLSTLASKPGPDVILLDIQMGEASGLDAIRPIKALSRSTQVLMFTTCFDSASKKRALNEGASDFLLKHFSIEEIEASIHRALKNPAPHLKRARTLNKSVEAAKKFHSSPADGKGERKAGGLFRRLFPLTHCLELIHSHRN
jgi:DNA-binding NarL/FixJ family response regulator